MHSIRKVENDTLFRPPDIHIGTYVLPRILPFFLSSFLLLSFFAIWSPSSLNETQPYPATWPEVGLKCNLKTHVQYLGYPLPLQIGGPKTTFLGRLRNLTATVTAYIFWAKHDIHKRASGLRTTNYIVPKRHELWSTNGFKLEVSFHQPSVNSASHFIARLRRRRSANGTRPNFAKRWTVGRGKYIP